jgi:hypothetical protein
MKYGLLQQNLKTLISNNEFYIIKMVVILEETHGYLIKRNKFKIILKLLIYLNNQ